MDLCGVSKPAHSLITFEQPGLAELLKTLGLLSRTQNASNSFHEGPCVITIYQLMPIVANLLFIFIIIQRLLVLILPDRAL